MNHLDFKFMVNLSKNNVYFEHLFNVFGDVKTLIHARQHLISSWEEQSLIIYWISCLCRVLKMSYRSERVIFIADRLKVNIRLLLLVSV